MLEFGEHVGFIGEISVCLYLFQHFMLGYLNVKFLRLNFIFVLSVKRRGNFVILFRFASIDVFALGGLLSNALEQVLYF